MYKTAAETSRSGKGSDLMSECGGSSVFNRVSLSPYGGIEFVVLGNRLILPVVVVRQGRGDAD